MMSRKDYVERPNDARLDRCFGYIIGLTWESSHETATRETL